MRRSGICFVLLFLFASGSLKAIQDQPYLNIADDLSFVKSVLASREWEPTDSATYKRLVALVNYIEYPSADSLLLELGLDAIEQRIGFVREIRKLKETESLKGYISDDAARKNCETIRNDIRRHIPLESIVVPESLFVGIYSRLPLIEKSDPDRIMDEALVPIPDSLKLLFRTSSSYWNRAERSRIDSLKQHYLDSVRIVYNNQIINHYRDSVSDLYRETFYEIQADSMVRTYMNAVSRSNQRFLSSYNDIKTKELNDRFLQSVTNLIGYADAFPNEVLVTDTRNNVTRFLLQNDEPWFSWLWLKNLQNDSIGIRVEGLGRHAMRMMVDESVNLSRLTQRPTADVSKLVPQNHVKHSLSKVKLPEPVVLPWSYGGTAYTGFSETYINDYWAKGGNTSASILTTLKYYANYTRKKIKWENNLDAKLGLIYYLPENGADATTNERNLHKNSDNLDLSSKLGVSAFKNWYYTAELVFKSQFFNGYKNRTDTIPASSFLSPGYVNFSIGMDYKPNKNLSVFLSPISLKTTIVVNPTVSRSTYNLADDQNIKSEVGSYMKLEHSRKITDNISAVTKNTLFVNFGQNENKEPLWSKFPDLDSETTLNFKVNQFITTTVNAHFIYDKSVKSEWEKDGVTQTGTRLQVKEFLTLGFTYRL